jgi:hypothetical protein
MNDFFILIIGNVGIYYYICIMDMTNDRISKIDALLKPELMKSATRKKVAKELHAMGDYHPDIPLERIFKTLRDNGIVVLMEDHTEWSGFLCGREGNCIMEIAYNYTAVEDNGVVSYIPIKNSGLSISWYKMNTCMEVTVYLS